MPLKILCVGFIFFVIVTMPAILINEALKFFSPAAINTAIVLGREDTMKYPNVTVCFAKFFDQTLLESKLVLALNLGYLEACIMKTIAI